MSRNSVLAQKVSKIKPDVKRVAALKVPAPNTKNLQGHASYALEDELKLVSMLNTLKLEDQFYKSTSEQVQTLRDLVFRLAKKDPYFVAQAIVYSRCLAEGMRTVNQAASVFLAPYTSGKDWADRFYSLFNKKQQSGGVIYRPDDMWEIAEAFKAITGKNITNAMKRGFARALQNMDAYSLLKYKNKLVDIINLTHPNPEGAATVAIEGKKIPVFEAIVKGYKVSADTWEANNSEAGQIVAKAVKEGKVSEAQAEQLLNEAKSSNWLGLLQDKKLGILAAIRNIRSILKANPTENTIDLLRDLLEDSTKIRQGKILPYQIDIARELLISEFGNSGYGRLIAESLLRGYEASIPNLKEVLVGRTLVIIDCSGSMTMRNSYVKLPENKISSSTALDKATLIGATIAKAVNADVIQFGGRAQYVKYDPSDNVFTLAKKFRAELGSTNLASAWQLASGSYDRVIILSDYEVNNGDTYKAYKSYIEKVGNPYVYQVDLAAYGTTQMKGDRVTYLYGYGFDLFDRIVSTEFNPNEHLEKIRKIVI